MEIIGILLSMLFAALVMLIGGLAWGFRRRKLFYREYQEQKLRRTGKDRLFVHSVGDGRGFRDVYVDGEKIENATYADEKQGIVQGFTIQGENLIPFERKGKVKVVYVKEY